MKGAKKESEEDFDLDQQFLDRVLNKLYDFGDGSDDKQRSKRKHVSHTSDAACSDRISVSTSAGCESFERKVTDVEIVRFQDLRKRKKSKRIAEPEPRMGEEKEREKKEPDVLSMEQARLDVHRFGITGFQKQQQRVFEQDRAIMLGARPPKKDYINYKVYQQMIKEKKSKEKEDETQSDAAKKKKKSSGKQKNVKRKSGSSSAEPSGHVGRFKNGMLVLSSKDFQKFNSKVKK